MAGKVYRRKDRGKVWYMTYIDSDGSRVRKTTGTEDLDAAKEILSASVTHVAKVKNGLIDDRSNSIRESLGSSVNQHIDAFALKMLADGVSGQWRCSQTKWLRDAANACRFDRLRDINATDFTNHIASLRRNGTSARTIAAVITINVRFCKWLVENRHLERNPLAGIKKPPAKSARVFERRMLLPTEWPWLKRFLLGKPEPENGIDWIERLATYETAIQTGLRAGEMRSLRRSKLSLGSNPPFVYAKSSATKNGQEAKQRITKDVAERIKILVDRSGDGFVFKMKKRSAPCDMLRNDLANARKLWLDSFTNDEERKKNEQSDFMQVENEDGEILDFHALRYTCGGWLAIVGVDVQTIQKIMRHHSVTMTIDTYGRLLPGAEDMAIERVARLF